MIFYEDKECCYLKFVLWCFILNFINYLKVEVIESKISKIYVFIWIEKWKIYVVIIIVLFIITYVLIIDIFF